MVAKVVHLATHRADRLREHVRAQFQHVLNWNRVNKGVIDEAYLNALVHVPEGPADAHRRGESDDLDALFAHRDADLLLVLAHHVHEN